MMISDKYITWTFINVAAIIVILSHQANAGRRYNLEANFSPYYKDSKWQDRIIFPESEEDDSTATRCQHMKSFEECMNRCPAPDCLSASLSFSPVCGTNDITYVNIHQMLCARICGVKVDLRQRSACSFDSATTEKTWTPPVVNEKQVNLQRCILACPSTPEYNPVCGTDLVVYHNTGKLECAKYCGVDVEFLRNAPCPKETVSVTTHAPTTINVEDIVFQDCLRLCPSTSEYNPVCGTNNVTYSNLSKLQCAKACGVDVSLQRFWPCNKRQPASDRTHSDEDEPDIDPRIVN